MKINCDKHGKVESHYLGNHSVMCPKCYLDEVMKFVKKNDNKSRVINTNRKKYDWFVAPILPKRLLYGNDKGD